VIDGSILGRLHIATVPKPKKKKTATHKISGSVKKKREKQVNLWLRLRKSFLSLRQICLSQDLRLLSLLKRLSTPHLNQNLKVLRKDLKQMKLKLENLKMILNLRKNRKIRTRMKLRKRMFSKIML